MPHLHPQSRSAVLARPQDPPQIARRATSRQPLQPRRIVALLIGAVMVTAALLTPSAQAEDGVHIIARGEHLSAIADRYDISLPDLLANNRIADPNLVRVGQRLVIPGLAALKRYNRPATPDALPGVTGYVTVAPGETLAAIAKQHGLTADDLMRLNGLRNAPAIRVGQRLRLSARVAPVAQTADDAAQLPVAETMHVVQPGESLETIAETHGLTAHQLMALNGLPHPHFTWAGQPLRIGKTVGLPTGFNLDNAPADGYRWIEVDLSEQTLTAWQGDVPVLHTSVSTGTSRHPTVTGRFSVGTKYSSQRMTGPGYDLPGVPWVMYFFSGYAIHGAYWHDNFGAPMSHGCVNMRVTEAEFLYEWADAGTEVYVHQ